MIAGPRLYRWVGTLLGIAGLAWFVHLVVGSQVLERLGALPAGLLLVSLLVGARHAMGSRCWARAFPRAAGGPRPGGARLFGIWLAGEAVNNGLASAYVAGEPVKGALAVRYGAPPVAAFASVLLGKTAFIFGEVVFLGGGIAVAAWAFGSSSPLLPLLTSVTAVGLAIVAAAVVLQQSRLVGRGTRLLRTLRLGPRRLWTRALPAADAIDAAVRGYYGGQHGDLVASVAWAALAWLFGTVEVFAFLLVACDVEHALLVALSIEAGVAVIKAASFVVPGAIGVQEEGIGWLFEAVGLGREAGLTYAVLRRFRELFWIGVGFALLGWMLRGPRARPAPGRGT